MNTKFKKTLITTASALCAIAFVTTATYAIGSLTPSGTAGDDTQYSLNDIYAKLTDFSDTPTATSSPFITPGSLSASFHTLSEIYGLIEDESDDLVPENIADGVEIFGVEGTLDTDTGPSIQWQIDPNQRLCFDASSGCYDGDELDAGLINGEGAFEYCTNLVTEGYSDWRLPTMNEFISLMDYSLLSEVNLYAIPSGEGFSADAPYWTSTFIDNEGYSYYIAGRTGIVLSSGITDSWNVRCVRPL